MTQFCKQWFDDFVTDTRAEVTGFLRQFLPSTADAQEVAQDAYLKLYVALRKQAHRDHSPRALLYTTAKNLALSRLRHQKVIDRTLVAVTVSQEIATQRISPEQSASRSQSVQSLLEVIQSLPPKRRMVIWLRLAEGLSQKEIAEKLGIAVSTVEKHLAHGLHQCRNAMRQVSGTGSEAAPVYERGAAG